MSLKPIVFAFTAAAAVGAPILVQAQTQTAQQTPGQVTLGAARFTVVSPQCIRLEYAPNNGFVDAPTLFAINRGARDAKAKIRRTADGVTIETTALRLVYRPDGQPFNASNLQVTFRNGKQAGGWKPGQANTGNLGGPVSTLDFLNRAINLPDGLVSRDGWSLVDDSGRAILNDNWIAPRPGGGPPTENIPEKNKDLDWYLFAYGQNYQDALRTLKTVSGPSAMPRRAVLGSWNSRWAKLTSDDYRQMVREYEEHDFPLDVVVMDMEWHTQNAKSDLIWADNPGWTGYTWNKNLIPDPQGLLQEFKKQGIYTTLNDHPHDGIREHEEMYPEFMRLMGEEPPKNLRFNAGSKKYMDAFFAASHTPLEDQGVDFWWLDWQQDSLINWVPGVTGLRHLPWLNELYYRQSERGGQRGQTYSRWGGWGDQRHPMQFSGDTTSNWNMLAFEVPFSAVSGNGGCFFWAHDTGGFFGSRNTEQYTRWTQFSGLSAALRVHSAGEDRRPWVWGKQAEDAMRITYRTRSEIFPYIYTSVRQSFDDMRPLVRPMYLDYPAQEAAYHNPQQYLFGDNLLVAPIVSPGVGPNFVAQQSVWFPQGTWYNFFTGERFAGNGHALVTGDFNETPVFARAGVPLPLRPYTSRMATEPINELRVRCYPGENGRTGTSSLYEDDGRSAAYLRGAFARTPLTYTRRGTTVEVRVGATIGNYDGKLATRSYSVELPATTQATRVTLRSGNSTQVLTSRYDAATQTNVIAVPALPTNQPVSITVVCGNADASAMQERAAQRRAQGLLGKPVSGGNVQSVLASTEGASPEEQQMLLATLGVGLMRQMEGPKFQENPGHVDFYAPQGLLDGNKVTLVRRNGASNETTLKNGILPLGIATNPRDTPKLRFSIGGRSFELPKSSSPLLSPENVAIDATVKASSTENGYRQEAVNDGSELGYPEDATTEWSSNGQKAGASVRLDWTSPQTVDRVLLFDRPNETDDILSGVIRFSDDTTVDVPSFANGRAEVRFPAKTVTWVTFEVTAAKPGTVNAGLAEFAVFKAK